MARKPAKKSATKRSKKVRDLQPRAAASRKVKGGGLTVRKAGGTQQEYLIVKMDNALITSV